MAHTTPDTNKEQAAMWNGHSGRAWVETQDLLDQMFMPLQTMLVDAVASAGTGPRVLDIGCGTGSTTLALARRLGAEADCTGIDISEPMIELARRRAGGDGVPATFIRADAQSHAFAPGRFDMLASRFGVMFFEDPVQAFGNLRRAASDTAQLRWLAWRSAAENPFMTAAERAAGPLLPDLPTRQPGAPGQFAFADQTRAEQLLGEAGWAAIDIQPVDVVCTLPEQDLVRYINWLGPVGARIQQADEPTRSQLIAAVRPAFAPYVQGSEVRYVAACWMISAKAARMRRA